MEYKEDLKINIEELEIEWLRQPGLYHQYAEKLAHAQRVMVKAHENVKIVTAELVEKAGKGGETLLGIKPTGANVESWYRQHEDHKEAKNELIDAQFEVNVLQGAVDAFVQRKKALEKLVDLWIGNYYASPKEPRSLDDIAFSMSEKGLDKCADEHVKKLNTKKLNNKKINKESSKNGKSKKEK